MKPAKTNKKPKIVKDCSTEPISSLNENGGFVRVGYIAQELDVSENTVYQWIKKGYLSAVNVSPGKRPVWRVRKRDFEDLFAKCASGKLP